MCLRPIYNVMIGFTASNFTLETLKIFYQQLWHTPGHRFTAEAGLMELSRALHLPSSIQSRPWVTQSVSYVFAHDTKQWRENELIFCCNIFCERWSLRSTRSCWQPAEVTAPSSLLWAGISFWLEILVSGRDDEMTSQSLNTFPAWGASSDETRHLSLSRRPCHGVHCPRSKCSGPERVWARRGMLLAFMEP